MQNAPRASDKPGKTCPLCGTQVGREVMRCPKDGTNLSDPLLQEPDLREKYEYIGTVGAGGMGVIYKAKHKALNKVVAIKMVHSQAFTVSPEAYQRFEVEGRAAAALSHPFIVPIYDLGKTAYGQPYMVMDFVVGQTLEEIFKEPELSVSRMLRIFIGVCTALSHAHKRGVIHRDVKPSNIMVIQNDDREEEVRIMDFGIAKVADNAASDGQQLTKTGEIMGSPMYMSPEQARGLKSDGRTDIYAMGCIIYEAFTGSPPHVGDSQLETIMKHLQEEPKSLADACPGCTFHPDVERMVTKLLRKDPDHRYKSMDELLFDLKKIQQLYEQAPIVELPTDPEEKSALKRALAKSREFKQGHEAIPDEAIHATALKRKLSDSEAAAGRKRIAMAVAGVILLCGIGAAIYYAGANHSSSTSPASNGAASNEAGTSASSTSGSSTSRAPAANSTSPQTTMSGGDTGVEDGESSAQKKLNSEHAARIVNLIDIQDWKKADQEAAKFQDQLLQSANPNYPEIIGYYLVRGACQSCLQSPRTARQMYAKGIELAKQHAPGDERLVTFYQRSAVLDEKSEHYADAIASRNALQGFLQSHKPSDSGKLEVWQKKSADNQAALSNLEILNRAKRNH